MGRISRISDRFISSVCARLADNRRVRRLLPEWGRLHIDRQLPFLCVYRKPADRQDQGTDKLVTGQASYLLASGGPARRPELSRLVSNITRTMAGEFGAFLIVEVWSLPSERDHVR